MRTLEPRSFESVRTNIVLGFIEKKFYPKYPDETPNRFKVMTSTIYAVRPKDRCHLTAIFNKTVRFVWSDLYKVSCEVEARSESPKGLEVYRSKQQLRNTVQSPRIRKTNECLENRKLMKMITWTEKPKVAATCHKNVIKRFEKTEKDCPLTAWSS